MKLYCIVDKKARDIVAVFSSLSDAAAERSFTMLLSGAQSIYTDYPEDFAIYNFADLECEGLCLKVSRPGVDQLNANGFKVDTYQVVEPLKDGSEFSKAFLSQLHVDRMNYGAIVPGTEDYDEN